ncbi:hypothetical protein HDU93_003300 [Gonapodya sp. JEL0774]|nr:hypothetical protein HDU93_003300 [Gonapodya sp. JEL0774]
MSNTKVAIIGAGLSGLCMAIQLKRVLGTDSFEIFEAADSIGGTWTSLVSATWDKEESYWHLVLRDSTGRTFERDFKILVSAVGSLHHPIIPKIPGAESFTGPSWHTARWRSDIPLAGKTIAVVGNGCSACQAVPVLAKEAKMLYNFAREPHWLVPQQNVEFGAVAKWLFRTFPVLQKMLYWFLILVMESGFKALKKDSTANVQFQRELSSYILKAAPKRYHDFLLPKYEAGCKRRVFDTGYLASLHRENVELVTNRITSINKNGVVTADGKLFEVDVIIYATGFDSQNPFGDAKIIGSDGVDIHDRWRLGGEALHGTVVAKMPNFFIMMVSFLWVSCSALISEIDWFNYMKGTQHGYGPLLGSVKSFEPRLEIQTTYNEYLQSKMKEMVWLGSCKSWYLNAEGKNTTLYPDLQLQYWRETSKVNFSDFLQIGGKTYRGEPSHVTVLGVSALVLAAVGLGVAALEPALPNTITKSVLQIFTENGKRLLDWVSRN